MIRNSGNSLLAQVFIFVVLLLSGTLENMAQAPKYSNEFLTIGVGGRALGMSGAQSAIVNDVTSGYWNPAGLTHIKNDLQLSLMHSEYFAGIAKYDYGSVVVPLSDNKRFVGFSAIRFAVDDIPNTLFLVNPDGSINYDNVSSFSAADYGFLFSYAQLLNIEKLKIENLRIGGNFKLIHRKVGPFASAWGFGLDFGLQYKLGKWMLGGVAKDVTSTFNAWSFNFTEEEQRILESTDNLVPESSVEVTLPRFIAGIGRSFSIKDKFNILGIIDFEVTSDGKRNTLIAASTFSLDPKLGIEADYQKKVFIRAGIGNFQKATDDTGEKIMTIQPNIGLGVQLKSISIDYALTDVGDQSQALFSHVFSLKVGIDKQQQ